MKDVSDPSDRPSNGHASSQSKVTFIPPTFANATEERQWLKFRLAQAFRIFGQLGYDEGVDLLLVDHSGQVLAEESGPHQLLNKAAFAIHSAIHTNRPDVLCAAHSHSIYGRAFATLGIELDMITQDSFYRQFNGVVLDEEEGRNVTLALGSRKNHGLLAASGSIEATVFWFSSLEKCCKAQLLADAAAAGRGSKTVKIADDDAQATYNSWVELESAKIERGVGGIAISDAILASRSPREAHAPPSRANG
ncbi:hypothetical protein HWV62_32938 [Athelia sp. TMB]|nr:hypothetical protein HWV62_32938 [Athelia sp. TMB]